jgi:hypothetical protein
MAKVRKINARGFLNNTSPLRVTTRKAHDGRPRKGGKSSRVQPRDLVRCGCCKERLEVVYDEHPTGDPNIDTLEINGVIGTLDQWRQFFLPHLGLLEQKKEGVAQVPVADEWPTSVGDNRTAPETK